MFQGLRTLGFRVPNLDEAKAWYSKVTGIEPYFDEPFYVGFNVAGYELGLMPEDGPVTRGESVLCYWGVEDIQAEYARLLELGATSFGEITDVGSDILTAEVKDPWGNVFGIIYNPHFKLPAEA